MNINLYNFSKRINSTKQPTGTGKEVSVLLKDGTSIYNPSFILGGTELVSYNYLKWDNRYYFINDISYINTLHKIELSCSMDYLATYKSNITATNAYVRYSTSNYDTDIPDNRLSTVADSDYLTYRTITNFFTLGAGYYVLQVHTKDHANYGTTAGYYLTSGELSGITGQLMSTNFLEFENLEKMFTDAASAIVGCTYIPINYTPSRTAAEVQLGAYNTGLSAGLITNRRITITQAISVSMPFNDWRNRYVTVKLYLPAYGWVNLRGEDIIGRSNLVVTCEVDAYTGEAVWTISDLFRGACTIGCQVPIGSYSDNKVIGTISSVTSAIASGISQNYGMMAISLYGAVTSAMSESLGNTGGTGGAAGIYASPVSTTGAVVVEYVYHDTTVDPSSVVAVMGRPLNRTISLSGLSGYVETVNASVSANAPEFAINTINTYLNGGVYLE